MAYERINRPQGLLYHYTKKGNLESILKDGRIRRFQDRECWFCTSLDDTFRLMELTVMQEGKVYYDVHGFPSFYPQFVAEEYVVLELAPKFQSGDWVIWNQEFPKETPAEVLNLGEEFSHLKKGFRGDLKFYDDPQVYEVSDFVTEQRKELQMVM